MWSTVISNAALHRPEVLLTDVTFVGRNRYHVGCVEHDRGGFARRWCRSKWGKVELEIDVGKVAGIATCLETSSQALGGIAEIARTLSFGPDQVGGNYRDFGSRIGDGFGGVETAFRRWSDASKDNAVRLRGSLAAYRSTDADAANSLYGTGAK